MSSKLADILLYAMVEHYKDSNEIHSRLRQQLAHTE